jgi:hypothetical protein
MARTTLATQQIARTGTIPTYSAANADGHSVGNRGTMFLHVKNGSGGSINVTLVTPITVGGRAVGDDVVAVGAGAEKMIGPLDPNTYNTADGVVHVDFSAVTTVTCAALVL